MALLATTFTMEIILLIIGLYLFDGGIIRKFGAIGIFVIDLNMTLTSQSYVSDLTAVPTNQFLFFTPSIQNAWAYMLAILIFVTISWTLISITRLIQFTKVNKLTLTQILEEFV